MKKTSLQNLYSLMCICAVGTLFSSPSARALTECENSCDAEADRRFPDSADTDKWNGYASFCYLKYCRGAKTGGGRVAAPQPLTGWSIYQLDGIANICTPLPVQLSNGPTEASPSTSNGAAVFQNPTPLKPSK